MEHILISPGKLKLMLTRGDLERYELSDMKSIGTVDCSRRSLKLLLEDAERLSGFDAGDEKLFLQLYPSKDGGAELYITRLGGAFSNDVRDETLTLTRIGYFDSMHDLLTCCAKLSNELDGCESSAFADIDGCYLVISEKMSAHEYLESSSSLKVESFFGEYGRNIRGKSAIYYVKEHCFNFCEKNAVKILSSMV